MIFSQKRHKVSFQNPIRQAAQEQAGWFCWTTGKEDTYFLVCGSQTWSWSQSQYISTATMKMAYPEEGAPWRKTKVCPKTDLWKVSHIQITFPKAWRWGVGVCLMLMTSKLLLPSVLSHHLLSQPVQLSWDAPGCSRSSGGSAQDAEARKSSTVPFFKAEKSHGNSTKALVAAGYLDTNHNASKKQRNNWLTEI